MTIKTILKTGSLALALTTVVATMPALAQKSKDTLRIPHHVQLQTIDFYVTPGPWDAFFSPSIYSSLIDYDPTTGKYLPNIAKSWKQTNPTTYEFDLFDDLKWSDGEKIDADDVVYIINWLVDPKVRLRLKANWAFIKGAEKLGPYKVRITTKRPTPFTLQRLAHGTYIYPQHIHEPLEPRKKRLFAPKGVSYGAYRLAKFNKATGIVLERNPDYRGNKMQPKASIGRIESVLIPDYSTQTAQLIAGGIDVIRGLPADRAEVAAKSRGFVHTTTEGLGFHYMAVYGQSQENVKALADPRVRRALGMAINRNVLQQVAAGKTKINVPADAVCTRQQAGCDFTKTTPAYDPAGAKKLLADAGYGDGFDLRITTFAGSMSEIAQVAGGMLRKIGIRSSVQGVPIPAARKLAKNRKLELIYYGWGGGGMYDVSAAMGRFFLRPEFEDKQLAGLARQTMAIVDPEKRKAAVAKTLDYAVEQGYLFPMIRNVINTLHTKEVRISSDVVRPVFFTASDLVWK